VLPPDERPELLFNIADPAVFRSTILIVLEHSCSEFSLIQLARVSSKDTMPDGPRPISERDEIQPLLVSCGRKVKFNAIGGVGLLCCCGVKVGKRIFMRRLLIEDP